MGRFGFVILHYQTIDYTIQCINSIIKKNQNSEYYIIIVDNNSPNKSGEILKEKFKEQKNISVLINKKNLGFARGNNTGYRYAKDVLKCDFIIFLNNDTLVLQKDFCELISGEFQRSRCAVIGPMILKNGVETGDNPRRREPFKLWKLLLYIVLNYVMFILSYVALDKKVFQMFDCYVMKQKKKNVVMTGREENVALHGCCLICTPIFLENMEGLDPRTFMYMEEDILYEQILMKSLKMVYLPTLKIEHLEGIATNEHFKKETSRRRFVYKNTIKSAKVLLKIKFEK